MVSRRKTAHICTNLGNNNFGGLASNPRNGIQQSHRFFKRAAVFLNLFIKPRDGLVQTINLAQQFGQNKTMMGFDASFQCLG